MSNVLPFLFVLGVLVFVHELGHFLVARWHGVRVLTFSLGFGPKLLSIRRGDTEYCVSAIPLGGYVKMAGENADSDAPVPSAARRVPGEDQVAALPGLHRRAGDEHDHRRSSSWPASTSTARPSPRI